MSLVERMRASSIWIVLVVASCAHPNRPTIAGAELYANLDALARYGHVALAGSNTKPVEVRYGQLLVTEDAQLTVAVDALVRNCPAQQIDETNMCPLADLQDRRFRVVDQPRPSPAVADDNTGLSFRAKFGIAGVAIALPLTYGVVACGFPGCQPLFGVPLALDAVFMLFGLVGMH
jgi:hypothetical protein